MDKIFSTRVDEATVRRIGLLARRLNMSKKKIIESAIQIYADKMEQQHNIDVLDQTFGAWHRKGSADQIVRSARKAFRSSMIRHKR